MEQAPKPKTTELPDLGRMQALRLRFAEWLINKTPPAIPGSPPVRLTDIIKEQTGKQNETMESPEIQPQADQGI